jgi:hypothetical protein
MTDAAPRPAAETIGIAAAAADLLVGRLIA